MLLDVGINTQGWRFILEKFEVKSLNLLLCSGKMSVNSGDCKDVEIYQKVLVTSSSNPAQPEDPDKSTSLE
jgi:hypothetical protein